MRLVYSISGAFSGLALSVWCCLFFAMIIIIIIIIKDIFVLQRTFLLYVGLIVEPVGIVYGCFYAFVMDDEIKVAPPLLSFFSLMEFAESTDLGQ